MRRFVAVLALVGISLTMLASRADSPETNAAPATPDTSHYEVWITGQPFTQDGLLLFRADKAVQGNRTGKVVLLGTNRNLANFLLPVYMKAAEKHITVRLYGVLVPAELIKGHEKTAPTVEFITWKVHAPGDPDVLPPGQALYFDGKTAPNFTNAAGQPEPPMKVQTNAP